MAAFNEHKIGESATKLSPDDEIVISGISGKFPNCENVLEYQESILNKVDLTSEIEKRWDLNFFIPPRFGMINGLENFDSSFFGIPKKHANILDPMARLLLEKSYEAIIDAGCNPKELKDSKTGVFVGLCSTETESYWCCDNVNENVMGLLCTKSVFGSYISYHFGLNGPSYTIDTACSSSLYALDSAYNAIKGGQCDAALVAGINLCLHPYTTLRFFSLGVLAEDGRCKVFDESANGYTRSEAVAVLFLQKAKDAKRIYSTVVHVKTNCDGFKEEGITFPSAALQARLLTEFYEECMVDPSTVAWIEAHGTGTKVGDPEEVKVLEKVFCKNRETPLLIASVKSNIGHSEPAAGVCSIVKVLIAMQTGIIPPNINITSPRQSIESLHNGKISVVTERTPWNGSLVGINCFGFGGANGHVLLQWNKKKKVLNKGEPSDEILPFIVVASGRTEQAVKTMLKSVEHFSFDKEYIKLLYEIHKESIPGHTFRGYLYYSFSTGYSVKHIKYFEENRRDILFVFRPSKNEEFPVITNQMMKLPGFASVIQRCHTALVPYGVSLFNELRCNRKNNLANPTCILLVCIASIQIGLLEVMKNIGIIPDKLLGFGIGDLISVYADGVLSLEQTIIAIYYCSMFMPGAIKNEYKPIENGDSAQNKKNIHSSNHNIKIHSSPVVKNCNSINGHLEESSFNDDLLSYLKKIIPDRKSFSNKYTSVKNLMEANHAERVCSAEYINMIWKNSVHSNGVFKKLKKNCVIVDFSFCNSDWNLEEFDSSVAYIPLISTRLNHDDFIKNLFIGFGRFYEEGLNPHYAELYPQVDLPVSRGTPMIAPHVVWDHSKKWFVYTMLGKKNSSEKTFSISLKDERMEYLSGHVIDGRNLFPATGYLELVWELFEKIHGGVGEGMLSIVFKDVKFHRATNIPKEGAVHFHTTIQLGSGNFQVVEGGAVIVTGFVFVPNDFDLRNVNRSLTTSHSQISNSQYLDLSQKDIYKELRIRGYNYSGLFRSITRADSTGKTGKISWHDNWVAFMDNMLQMQILNMDSRNLVVPVSIKKIVINTEKHLKHLPELKGCVNELPVEVFNDMDLIKSGGVEIRGLIARIIPRKKSLAEPVLEKYEFIPYSLLDQELEYTEAIKICTHLVLENIISQEIMVLEDYHESYSLLASKIVDTLGDLPLLQGQISVLSNTDIPTDPGYTVKERCFPCNESASLVIIPFSEETTSQVLMDAFNSTAENGFIMCREIIGSRKLSWKNFELYSTKLTLVFEAHCMGEKISLLKKTTVGKLAPVVVKINDHDLSWLPELKRTIKKCSKDQKHVLIVSQGNPDSGLIGFTNCIRKEPGGHIVRCILIQDKNAPIFAVKNLFYSAQLKKHLAINVFKNGHWGSYRHLPLSKPKLIKSKYGCVDVLCCGDLSTLTWSQFPEPKESGDMVLVNIYYSAINFRDIMLATGRIPPRQVNGKPYENNISVGFEFSGRLSDGRRVMGVREGGCFGYLCVADKNLIWDVPYNWSLEDAATVPIVYLTVIIALFINGRMSHGESILIHAGSGGVGLAAITMAFFVGCTVYTTVGSDEKRKFIKSQFPQLSDRHIGYSRDTSFEQFIMQETNGKGVDLVLNSLAEEKLDATVRCLAKNGRFLEIGKYDLQNNRFIGMNNFKKLQSFHAVMVDSLFDASTREKLEIHKLFSEVLKSGAVKPLRRTVFYENQFEKAFRYMGAGKHMGKVLVRIREEEKEFSKVHLQSFIEKEVEPRFYCKRDKTYIVIGGLGGFGLELTDWLVSRGARNLLITSRNGVRTGYQSMRIRIWRKYNVNVEINISPLTSRNEVKKMLITANELAPVAGIFNLAVVLKDGLFENLEIPDFETSLKPKACVTSLLDEISKEMCPQLEQFVVFSSVSCGRGNAGQTNYGMANSIMERICERRRKQNLPGLAVQWGAVGDVGLVADMQEENIEVIIGGTLQQKINNCLEVMNRFLLCPDAVVSSMVVAEKRSRMGKLGNIIDTVLYILGIRDRKAISSTSTLAELGMDSMMAVEIKQILEQKFEILLTMQAIRVLTVSKLLELSNNNGNANFNEETMEETITELPSESLQNDYLIRVIGSEKLAEKSVVELPSLCSSSLSLRKAISLIVMPGIEGSSSVMEPFAKNLYWKIYCLQYSCKHYYSSIQEMAQHLISDIKQCVQLDDNFAVVGYSFGCIVAMEVILLLEKEGYRGHLILLDGSPDYIKFALSEAALNSDLSENNIQNFLLARAVSMVWNSINIEFSDKLNEGKNWKDKLNLYLDYTNESEYSKKYQKEYLEAIYSRLKAALCYEGPLEKSIKSSVALIRPSQKISSLLAVDYGLSKFCAEEVSVHELDGNHITLLENKKLQTVLSHITGFKANDLLITC